MNDITQPDGKTVRLLVATGAAVVAAGLIIVGAACAGTAMTRSSDGKPKAIPSAEEPEPSRVTVTIRPAPTTSTTTTAPVPPAPAWHRLRIDREQAELALANRGFSTLLSANQAECRGPNPEGFNGGEPLASPYDLELTEDLTADALVEACLDGYYYGQSGPRADAVLCVRDGAFPRPVVAIGWSCDDVDAVAASDTHMARLNAMRAVEVALMADPTDCPTEADTLAWTERILRDAELDLSVHVHNEPHVEHGSSEVSPPVHCPLLTRVDWDESHVYVEPFHS